MKYKLKKDVNLKDIPPASFIHKYIRGTLVNSPDDVMEIDVLPKGLEKFLTVVKEASSKKKDK